MNNSSHPSLRLAVLARMASWSTAYPDQAGSSLPATYERRRHR